MKYLAHLFLWSLFISLIGCGAPKPPGWPAGEERPINPGQSAKAMK